MDADRGDEPPFPPVSPPDVVELTDEQADKQNALKQSAVELLEDGKREEGLAKLSEAIVIGCASALLYCRRAGVLMQMDRPRAVINDCTAALAVNPDSAKAFKLRARANAKLQWWQDAHADFQTGLKIDFDDQTEEDSKVAAEKAKALRDTETSARVKKETEDYDKKLIADKAAYEAAVKARNEIWTDAKEAKYQETCKKAEEDKKRKEQKAQPGYKPETAASKVAATEAAEAEAAAKMAAEKAAAEKRLAEAKGDAVKTEPPPATEGGYPSAAVDSKPPFAPEPRAAEPTNAEPTKKTEPSS